MLRTLVIVPVAAALFVACPDSNKKPLGSTCSSDGQCESGACIAGTCLDPEGDDDGDGLINRLEGALGTNPLAPDTDADGVDDLAEVGDPETPSDSDGDGDSDALEPSNGDADSDCIADQFDPDDASPETDPTALADAVCDTDGVCSGAATASCPSGSSQAVCDYLPITEYEAEEITCDNLDNDCDGDTDEPFKPGGTVDFDGGLNPGDAGKFAGDSCGTGACAGGIVQCTASGSALECSTIGQAGALACTGDGDCNGVVDTTQVAEPRDLAGCTSFYEDTDTDTYGAGAALCLCSAEAPYTASNADDCDPARDDVYPDAPAICGEDADCDDDLRDTLERCDDGNTDFDDGCYECSVVEKAMGTRGAYAGYPHAANLANGGFVVGWDDGSNVTTEESFGRVLGFFDAEGRRVAVVEGLGLPPRAFDYRWDLVALRGGDVIYGEWRRNLETPDYAFTAQRYSADGAPKGTPLTIVPNHPSGSYQFELVALGGNGYAFAYDDGSGSLVIDYVDANDAVSPDGTALRSFSWQAIDGYADGTLVIVGNDEGSHFIQKIGADGELAGEPTIGELPTASYLQALDVVAVEGGGAVMIILGYRYENDVRSSVVGYQRFSSALAPDGDLRILDDQDQDGCPYEVVGGIDSLGNVFVAISDGECGSRARAWYDVAGEATRLELASDRHEQSDGGIDVAGGSHPLFIFDWEPDGPAKEMFVRRFEAGAVPLYVPDRVR